MSMKYADFIFWFIDEFLKVRSYNYYKIKIAKIPEHCMSIRNFESETVFIILKAM
jgi:hypothetical protein